jgi:hypothetical protein
LGTLVDATRAVLVAIGLSISVMPGLVPGIHAFPFTHKDVDGRDIRAFTPVFDGLCPAMTVYRISVSSDM